MLCFPPSFYLCVPNDVDDVPPRDGSRCNYVKYTSFPISFDLYFILSITKDKRSCKMMFLTVQTTNNELNYNL